MAILILPHSFSNLDKTLQHLLIRVKSLFCLLRGDQFLLNQGVEAFIRTSKKVSVEGAMRGVNRLVLSLCDRRFIGIPAKKGGLARPSSIGLVGCPSKGLIFSTTRPNFAQDDNCTSLHNS